MTNLPSKYAHGYDYDPKYSKSVAYFCMEYGIDQALKIYSGGLGFLAGSHMRSAFELKQNVVGIGILWKNGYYDQFKKEDRGMGAMFREKIYHFLEETDIKFKIEINQHPVWIKAFYLKPTTFNTAPIFLLSTDLPENDFLARSTTFKLYDSDPKAKVAQCIVLGLGGAKLLDELNYDPEIYHLNEAHAVSSVFNLLKKNKNIDEVKKKIVFTTHTPEEAGNEKHEFGMLNELGFFNGFSIDEVKELTGMENETKFNHSLAALRLSGKANGVSKLHGEVSREMWKEYENISVIDHVTNAQNKTYWSDNHLNEIVENNDKHNFENWKKFRKRQLFSTVADQTGRLFNENYLTIVWARRFAEYKRADLITKDLERFAKILDNKEFPVQLIFAGKPYPMDYNAIHTYDNLTQISKSHPNMAVLAGYELDLSDLVKKGSDLWLNNPRVTREASGTSGMTAAMNGSINFSTNDGWIREFDEMHPECSFVLPIANQEYDVFGVDKEDLNNLYEKLENQIIPLYYKNKDAWNEMAMDSARKVVPFFDSNRMADEYYSKIYNF